MRRPSSFLWLSGWSVPACIWDNSIACWPDVTHHKIDFLSCTQPTEIRKSIKKALHRAPKPVCIIAWSLGALATLDILPTLNDEEIHSLYLLGVGSQFVRATDHPYGWDQRVLRRMKKQLLVNKSDVITAFDTKMFTPTKTNETWEKLRVQSPSTPALLAGLDYLMDYRVNPSIRKAMIPIHILAGNEDTITPLDGTHHLHHSLRNSTLTIWSDTGHIPFWNNVNPFHLWIKNCMSAISLVII